MAKFAELTVELELQQAAFQKGMDAAARSLAKVQAQAKQSQTALAGMEKGLQTAAAAVATLTAAFGAFKGVQAIVKASDEIRNLQGSFTALLGDAGRANEMLGRVFAVVDRTGAPFKETAAAVQRLTIAMEPLGATNVQIATLAENFIKLGKVGGSSADDVANALVQLSQGLASGALGGDELKSIRENVPLVAKAIADGLGVPIGKLKELGEQGALTSDVVANAMLKATAKIDAAFAGLPLSFDQAVNKIQARAVDVGAEFDKASGISQTLVTTTGLIASNLARWHSELVVSRDSLTQMQTLADVVSFTVKLIASTFTTIDFAVEQIVKRMTLWLQYAQALINLDWGSMDEALKRFNEQFDASVRAHDKALKDIWNPPGPPAEMFGPPAPIDLITKKVPVKGDGGKGSKEAEALAKALKAQGDALSAAVSPLNAFNQKMIEYNKLIAAGVISSSTYAKAVEKAKEELTAYGDALTASVDPQFEYEMAIKKVTKAYMDEQIEIETLIKLEEKLKAERDKKIEKSPFQQITEDLTKSIGSGVGQFFEDILNGSLTAEQAFSKMVKSIIADIAKLLAELAAAEAAKFIIKSIFGSAGGASVGGKSASAAAFAVPSFNAGRSLGLSATPLVDPAGMTTGTMGASGGAGPWNVVINNNAPVDVRTATRSDGGLEVTIDRIRQALTSDVARGGNPFSRALEGTYALGRGR